MARGPNLCSAAHSSTKTLRYHFFARLRRATTMPSRPKQIKRSVTLVYSRRQSREQALAFFVIVKVSGREVRRPQAQADPSVRVPCS
uniref:Uncharacterized protein n=1 Tax=Hyaloperonospora arabidopsidis (strain Emoy2) TaxID=559515 RepID=M4BT90_HYAAE